MRFLVVFFTATVCLGTVALAQDQQAGNQASTNADETFKKLIEKCDDIDALVLRTRVRLALGRLDDQATIKSLNEELDKGLSICGEGKVDEAKIALKKTLEAADANVTEKFGQEGDSAKVTAAPADDKTEAKVTKAEEKKPWWKFW